MCPSWISNSDLIVAWMSFVGEFRSNMFVLYVVFVGLISLVDFSFQQDCSVSNPCPLGCCSKCIFIWLTSRVPGNFDTPFRNRRRLTLSPGSSGWCGMGPDYCGKPNCVASCDSKSECDPGWGSSWSNSTKCPLNVCCSKVFCSNIFWSIISNQIPNSHFIADYGLQYGFCGTTNDFCNGTKVDRPSCSSGTIDRVIGYYESWSLTDRACNGMKPEQIPYGVYTHIK